MKILIAGNPDYGLAKSLHKIYAQNTSSENTKFVSRTHGNFDLSIPSKQRELADLSMDYDVFIAVSCIHRFAQVEYVQEVAKRWIERKHGHIVAIGSSADTSKGSLGCIPEKKALRAYCRQLSQSVLVKMIVNCESLFKSGNLHISKQDENCPE